MAVELERAWLREILDALPTPAIVYDAAGRVLYANRANAPIVGGDLQTLEEQTGRTMPRHRDGTVFGRDELVTIRALRGETVANEWEQLRTFDGRDIVMLASAAPLRDERGEIVAAIVTFHDITQLAELDRGRRELFGMASHDLRTPLTTILGHVQLARRQLARDPDRAVATLGDIERQCQRMARLVTDLLDAARFETGAIPVVAGEHDLVGRAREAIARQRDGERVVLDAPASLPARFDADRIDQVLDNLLTNAMRHTAPGTSVHVSLEASPDEVTVAVRDHGPGISAEEQVKLFTAFYQTPRGRTFGGTGLGLYISRRIAEAHGGRLWLDATGPEGSTFRLALPR